MSTLTVRAPRPAAPAVERRPGGVRELLKAAARGAATLLVLPWLLVYWLKALFVGRDRALEGSSESLSRIPGLPGKYLRRAFLACVLAECHPTASVGFGVLFSRTGARIGANVYLGPRCHIGLVTLERDVLLAAGVHVTSGAQTHGFDDLSRPIREQEGTPSMVRIGAGSWIGSAAVVMADIGRDTVVGAGAVVVKPLPDAVIAAGVPARVIRSRGPAPVSESAAE
jgi:acetyltransferase-like isoleucine patch superfamily enzyme